MLNLSYDYLTCWLRSLEEAKSIQLLQEKHLRHTSQKFPPPLFRSDTDYTPSGDELTYSPFTSTDDTSTTTTLTLMTNTTYSSDTNDHSIESSTTYLGLFKDDSDINIFSDDSHSDNTNISLLAYKPFEDS